jgi:hypothetical protein
MWGVWGGSVWVSELGLKLEEQSVVRRQRRGRCNFDKSRMASGLLFSAGAGRLIVAAELVALRRGVRARVLGAAAAPEHVWWDV